MSGLSEWFATWRRAFITMWIFRGLGLAMVALQLAHMVWAGIVVRLKLLSLHVDNQPEETRLQALFTLIAVKRRKAIDQVFVDVCAKNLRCGGGGRRNGDPLLLEVTGAATSSITHTLTKEQAVQLTEEFAQVVASFLHWGLPPPAPEAVVAAAADPCSRNVKEVHSVAVLMPNCVEYYPLVFGVSRATVWLNVLRSCSTPASRKSRDAPPYHHVSAALLNTNVASPAMLRAALEVASASLLVIAEEFLPLLRESSDARGEAAVALPPQVRSVLVVSPGGGIAPAASLRMGHDNVAADALCGASFSRWSRNPLFDWALGAKVVCSVVHDVLEPARQLLREAKGMSHESDAAGSPSIHVLSFLQRVPGASPTRRILGASLNYLAIKRCLAAFDTFRLTDAAVMIYTSGTTGLPKAAKFSHLRFHAAIMLSRAVLHPRATLRRLGQDDRLLTVYNCLPMYHSAGGVFCAAHLLHFLDAQCRRGGCSARMVIRKKFSARGFERDLRQFQVTVVQYIGELLRYALAATTLPRSSNMNGASEALVAQASWQTPYAFGNGIGKDIWHPAKHAFHFEHIAEFYASTEGNVGFCNYFDEPHAVGHVPVFPWPLYALSPHLWRLFPMVFCKFDADREEPWRDGATGRCARAATDEPAEVLGVVKASGFDPLGLRRFDGYVGDESASRRKLLHDVLRPGDTYFRTGDLLRFDKRGFVYFVDRVGDTFRWKGENVSTLEVANSLNSVEPVAMPTASTDGAEPTHHVAIVDSVVFGVGVPGHEGRAGMVKLLVQATPLSDTADDRQSAEAQAWEATEHFMASHLFPQLWAKNKCNAALPSYAIPIFCRVELRAPAEKEGPVSPLASDHQHAVGQQGKSLKGDEEMTETFKHRKLVHQRLGLHPMSKTRLFVLRPTLQREAPTPWAYAPLDAVSQQLLIEGKLPPGWSW